MTALALLALTVAAARAITALRAWQPGEPGEQAATEMAVATIYLRSGRLVWRRRG